MAKPKDSSSSLILVLGDQLFPAAARQLWGQGRKVFMAESWDLCTHYRYHKQKILLFLASMRHYRDELLQEGHQVHYHELGTPLQRQSFVELLAQYLEREGIKSLAYFEINDRFMENEIEQVCLRLGIEQKVWPSPAFLTPRSHFTRYLQSHKQPKMQSFYQEQRLRLGVMVEKGKPWGGKWSFDSDNRQKLPDSVPTPPLPKPTDSPYVEALKPWVAAQFADHPGELDFFIWPVTREGALSCLARFFEQRFELFGPYEDAMTQRSELVFHSGLSPLLNLGLLTPDEVLSQALAAAEQRSIELGSLEGFVRQLIGWREFIFGIDRNFGTRQSSENFFQHQRTLNASWYEGTTGLLPLDHCIRKAKRLGYVHHIERLMLLSNLMLLCEIHPHAVYRWFMELFVDSADWVMGPNVFGMGQFSDGGIFATKPYIAGSNYVRKMSDFGKGPWCDVMDGLYWRFIARHREFFASQPRLSMMVHLLEKIPKARYQSIVASAEEFLAEHTSPV